MQSFSSHYPTLVSPETAGLCVDKPEKNDIHFFAILYLALPLILFFMVAVRYEISIPALAFITYLLYQEKGKEIPNHICRYTKSTFLLIGLITLLWLYLTGGLGIFMQNGDWKKHHAIINLIRDSDSWPTKNYGILRYSVGFHLVPAYLGKLTDINLNNILTYFWSSTGVFLFFSSLNNFLHSKKTIFITIFVFIFFSGADLGGSYLTGFIKNTGHLEWWPGWIQYLSNTVSILWVPQHAIPSWLGLSLIWSTYKNEKPMSTIILIPTLCCFWSPFAAMGLVPFTILYILKFGIIKTLLNWNSMGAFILLGIPVILYLTTGVGSQIPMGMAWNYPKIWAGGPTFTFLSYGEFLLIELGPALALIYLLGDKRELNLFLIVAVGTLCLLPFFRFGIYNDLATRASLPALAVVALETGKVISNVRSLKGAMLVIIFLALIMPTPILEVYHNKDRKLVEFSESTFSNVPKVFHPQYFSKERIPILRHNK